ncbi:SDR family NAD(P)-dependent oxidoreductase [Ensifer soli]|uniref:SDR family NAD(P)-dependent oxidoreductase n=1 Tax=Ciceribacter sp. sgz301302 TaxID=3342379 RepID=UPI0035BB09E5
MMSLAPGYRALVIGASGGIGAAVADALSADPRCGGLTRLSRSGDGLDLTDEETVAGAARAIDHDLDLVFCATGALSIAGSRPEKAIREISPAAMMEQFALNALGPALVLKHFAPKLARQQRALMLFLSARVGSIGDNRLGGWISYRAAKAALNQIVHTAAIEIARSRPDAVVAALHPGTVATALTEAYAGNHARMRPDESAKAMLAVADGLRNEDSGSFLAYDGTPVPW